MRNIKLTLEYDGTNYIGWQRQDNGRSIQGEIETVLQQLLQESVIVIGAGRTDAGVHARGQVANFRTETVLSLEELKRGLNALLPDDIVVRQVDDVPMDFHARFSAKERMYSYLIAMVPSALMRNYSWYVKYRLDIDLMKRAASAIVGTHDFESFCRANADVDHHRCTVLTSCWQEDGKLLVYRINADRFLHGMVRALVGTMVDVGRGYTSFEEFSKLFEKKNRSEAGMAAPAKGLVLEKVVY
ncbi:MAG: tRNA pseudouridine(38-40) synthase TruA [Ignavibacteriae bacterium]|nr:tRNA pseudouridine(38-40) synthase TruA [Ignavibacteriota bacterium]